MQKNNMLEDYLECILLMQKKNGFAKSIDISHQLNVTKPTVSEMIKRLGQKDLICFDEKKCIYLTEKGRLLAQEIHDKNIFIEAFLLRIGTSSDNAKKEAGIIGNAISDETYMCLEKLYKSANFITYKHK